MTHLKVSSFKTAYIILIISAILAFTGGEVYFYYALKEQQGNYTLINIMGQQKTNLFQINNLLFNPLNKKIDIVAIESLINSLNKTNSSLKLGNESFNIPPIEEKEYQSYDSLDLALKKYMDAIMVFEINQCETNKKNFIEKQNQFIKRIDAMIESFNNDNSSDYQNFRHISWVLHLSGVLILVIEVFLIFIPMIKRIRQHDDKMTMLAFNQSHIIRHPLTNIMGLLRLVDKSKMDNKQLNLIKLSESEAQKLDNVLRENMRTIYPEKFTDQMEKESSKVKYG